MKWQSTYLIRAPIEDVFAFIANPEKWNLISGPDIRIEPEQPGPLARGARFRLRTDRLRVRAVAEVTAFDPPRRISFIAQREDAGDVTASTYRCEAVPEGTRVEVEEEVDAGRVKALLAALLTPYLSRRRRDAWQRVAEQLERSDGDRRDSRSSALDER